MFKIILQINKTKSVTLEKRFHDLRNAILELLSYEKTVAYGKKAQLIKRIFYEDVQVVGYHITKDGDDASV